MKMIVESGAQMYIMSDNISNVMIFLVMKDHVR